MSDLAIETHDLVRAYRTKRRSGDVEVRALDGVTLDVPRGELFGLLGPNGAGKTTLIKVLTTLLLPTSGTARVAGLDVASEARRIRERITMVSGGEHSGYGLLTVREQLWMFTQFYGIPGRHAKKRIDELLEVVGLSEARNRRVSALSSGMRQRMNLVRGLLPDPDILFLDEPTVGLDVAAARDIRAYINVWIRERPERTILLTTHYMQEADELCDRVAIIHKGGIIACDTPEALRRGSSDGSLFLLGTDPVDEASLRAVPGVRSAEVVATNGRAEVKLSLDDDGAISAVVQALAMHDRKIYSLQKIEQSLEEVFVRIVGQRLDEADERPVVA